MDALGHSSAGTESQNTESAPRITFQLMHRFYLPREHGLDSELTLTGREAHHGLRVLRVRLAEKVGVLDGKGRRYLCEVANLSRDTIQLKVLEKKIVEPLPYRITLVQAIPKGKTFEVIVQKATELGAHRVVPLLTERVVTRLDDEANAAHKVEKWRQVAIESIKQCGSPWLPEIMPPMTLPQFIARNKAHELSLVAALAGERFHARRHFERFQNEHHRLPDSISVWVGPEGDFTPDELAAILAYGALPVTLGPNVLRAETAAIFCLSVLSYELLSNAT